MTSHEARLTKEYLAGGQSPLAPGCPLLDHGIKICDYLFVSEVNNISESQGPATSSPQNVTPHPTTNNISPLSSFSEEFPAVPSPEVSISSSFGDDDDGMNVPVDDITPTLGQSPGSAVSYHVYVWDYSETLY